jgi:hypothetical protein
MSLFCKKSPNYNILYLRFELVAGGEVELGMVRVGAMVSVGFVMALGLDGEMKDHP